MFRAGLMVLFKTGFVLFITGAVVLMLIGFYQIVTSLAKQILT